MDELDTDDQRRLLGDLQALRAFLDEPGVESTTGIDDPRGVATAFAGLVAANEPPLLDDVVEDDFRVADIEPIEPAGDAAFADLDFGDDTDWTQFVDQVFAQTSGISLALDGPASRPSQPAHEDALLAEMTRLLDERLATLRAALVAEMRAMLARRRIG